MREPSKDEFGSVAREFGLRKVAVEDAIRVHQRPKLERYGDSLFVVLRPVHYLDNEERVEFGEIHAFLGPDFIVTVRHGEASSLGDVRQTLEREPEVMSLGPAAVLYAIMNARMQRQNEQVQKISAWAAILVVPTIVTGVYGMNFSYMPELSRGWGYPFALVLMVAVSSLLYLGFRRSGWL